jgi:hypothetical protein
VYRATDGSSTISDGFAVKPNGSNSLEYYSYTNALVDNNTKNTPLGTTSTDSSTGRVSGWIGQSGSYSFAATPVDYKYDFTAAQVAKLNEYIANRGDIALALDPDGSFFNDGITLTLTTGPLIANPEPATLTLFGLGFGAAAYARRRTRRRSAATS